MGSLISCTNKFHIVFFTQGWHKLFLTENFYGLGLKLSFQIDIRFFDFFDLKRGIQYLKLVPRISLRTVRSGGDWLINFKSNCWKPCAIYLELIWDLTPDSKQSHFSKLQSFLRQVWWLVETNIKCAIKVITFFKITLFL